MTIDQWRSEVAFGKIQGRKLLDGPPGSKGNRYQCELCGSFFMSDEAVQMHMIYHALTAQTEVIRQFMEREK